MCIIFFTLNHPVYKLVIAANRDEYITRPARRAGVWPQNPHVIGGIDFGFNFPLKAPPSQGSSATATAAEATAETKEAASPDVTSPGGDPNGTWLGVTTDGRFAFITNYREPPHLVSTIAQSRGHLVGRFLTAEPEQAASPEEYLTRLSPDAHRYNGFNLVVGDIHGSMFHISNRKAGQSGHAVWNSPAPIPLANSAVYGMSNGMLFPDSDDDVWPKVRKAKAEVEALLYPTDPLVGCESQEQLIEKLLDVLSDTAQVESAELLPKRMFNYNLERLLSAVCIDRRCMPNQSYGTRTQTIVLIDRDGNGTFVERDRYKVVVDEATGQESIIEGNFTEIIRFTAA
ncbi:NRDE protein-domain-containing protein [Polychytrium aggregatum]|uniref:NRDE protein-domain-containing protein n=1 Tax=Polychytrium aggregatum TaxID=110093 RepID=UPI0022FEE969|nr:NRDE protein-domain-containing protein [Polychytrium aggregatum]KAI9203472.1 NRDE protein-domain-containing protein [Polychytrium aggregatum]